MQINRLFGIIYLLLDKKQTTAKELSRHFEVSTRTIMRDLDILSGAGIPIYTTQGKGGGISILDNYVLNKTTISEEEQNQIIFALQTLAAAEHLNTDPVLNRLTALFDKSGSNWIEVDFSRWGNARIDKKRFELLKDAIIQKRSVSFLYPNYSGKDKKRTIHPLKLVFKSRSWYLQGYCTMRKDYRTFKVNRLLALELLEDSFAQIPLTPPPIEAEVFVSDSLIPVKMKFAAHAAHRVYDEFDQNQVERLPDGSFLISMEMPHDHWIYDYLLSFGTSAQIIEPAFLKEQVLQRLEEIKKMYS